MAELQSPQHPLEVLPAMLNLMLVQTGKFFKEAASNGPGDLVSARDLLKEVGTSANRRFHEALDELEIECTRAKAVFERDLRKARAKRAERERAAGILTRPAGVVKARSPVAGTKKSPPAISADVQTKDAEVQEIEEKKEELDKDAIMTNGLDSFEGSVPKPDAPETPQMEATKQEGVNGTLDKGSSELVQDPNKTESLLASTRPDQAVTKIPSPKAVEPAVATTDHVDGDSSFQPQPDTQEAAPFESMFNDLEQPTNANSLDFDLGFSTSPGLLNDSVFESIDMTNMEANTNLNATSSEDINTLLPGLENYVNDGGDFSMIDLSAATMPELTAAAANPPPGTATAGADNTASTSQGNESAPMESNFDDLFGSGDWAADGEMGDGAIVDFDEDWFNTDA